MRDRFEKLPGSTSLKQNIGLIVTCIAILVIFMVFGWLSKKEEVPFSIDNEKSRIKISDVTNGAGAEDRWLQLAQNKLKDLDKVEKQNEILMQKISSLEETITALENKSEEELDHKAVVDAYSAELDDLRQSIYRLEENKSGSAPEQKIILPNKVKPYNPSDPFSHSKAGAEENSAASESIMSVDFELSKNSNKANGYSLENYIPAGSYVQAKVISGVDASVGLESQTDPRPILFRVTGQAVSSLHKGAKQLTDIRGCIVTGAAAGDLSSEKVFVRLLKMTCEDGPDNVTETSIKGYAAAIGKAGIRGPVISREGDFVVKSFFAGLTSGFGDAFAKSMVTPVTLNGATASTNPQMDDIAAQGLGKGIKHSGNTLSNYLIKRAEQYQPVISIPSGIEVELVFHEGVKIGGNIDNIKQAIK